MSWMELFPVGMGIGNLAAAVAYIRAGQYPVAFLYVCYALSCAGLVWVGVSGRGSG